jgi:hypothetical protein
VNADRDRDRLLEEALKHELGAGRHASATAACLDAETLAAWTDGGLDAQAAALAEAHVSSCARCQAIVGTLSQPMPAATGSESRRASLWRWWMAPLAAGAAAVVIWMVVPAQRDLPLPDTVAVAPPAAPSEPAAPARLAESQNAAAKDQAKNAAKADRDTGRFAELKRRADARDRNEKLEAAPEPKVAQEQLAARAATAEPAAPPPPAAAADAGVRQLRMQQRVIGEVASADNLHRWRPFGTGIVEYSADGGQTWRQVLTGIDAEITTGSSPSPIVCWLVGRGGVVLLAIDGITFNRLPFPERVDLTAVTATDARIALVTTIDGRHFRTDDSGRTWRRQ